MKELSRSASLLVLHLIVLIWGFTGILGHEIQLDAVILVWWRVLIAIIALGAFGWFMGKLKFPSRSQTLLLLSCGLVVGAHWIAFFAAIKASTVSVALCAISTNSFFVALLSPLFGRGKWQLKEFILSAMVVLGLIVIFRFEAKYWLGISLGLVAAFLAAFFSSANAQFIKEVDALAISFWELVGAFVGIGVFVSLTNPATLSSGLSAHDFKCLLLLGVVCTAFAMVASVEVMKKLSAFTCALAINLEPVYTIILALLFYRESEYMTWGFYVGLLCIMSTLLLDVYWDKIFERKKNVDTKSTF
jgi:drug/metabolite transporter (DMT)-like permease